jgi:hypothetical protein
MDGGVSPPWSLAPIEKANAEGVVYLSPGLGEFKRANPGSCAERRRREDLRHLALVAARSVAGSTSPAVGLAGSNHRAAGRDFTWRYQVFAQAVRHDLGFARFTRYTLAGHDTRLWRWGDVTQVP